MLLILLRSLCLSLLVLVFIGPSFGSAAEILHHDLRVRLMLSESRLQGVDAVTVSTGEDAALSFQLSRRSVVSEILVGAESRPFRFSEGALLVPLKPGERLSELSVKISYAAVFDDPIPERPLNTDNPGYGVTGIVSSKGCFLLPGSGWYPDMKGSRPSALLEVEAPQGFLAVSAGRSLGHVSEKGKTLSTWEMQQVVEGLSLSAGPYVLEERKIGKVAAATYFRPESTFLSKRYLDAVARYIRFYEALIGPYPFAKFAVVENFFPTGYGFPSYTLLGSSVIRLPFIIKTSLGHEIAHCWWGNGVLVDYESGNWCEGLTTYLSDYLFKEKESTEAGRDYRIQILRKYAALVDPRTEFSLRDFRSRYDPASQAIGYGKGAMVFHMLRKRLGETAFWNALREVYQERLFQKTSWRHFQAAFEKHGRHSLTRFFREWIERKGAPRLSLACNGVAEQGDSWRVHGRLEQAHPIYELELSVVATAQGRRATHEVVLSSERHPLDLTLKGRPQSLAVDPEYDVFRRLHPSEIPPSVNRLKGSKSVLLVVSGEPRKDRENLVRILSLSLGLENARIVSEDHLDPQSLGSHDLLFIGLPKNGELLFAEWPGLRLGKEGFVVDGRSFNSPSDVFFGVFSKPQAEGKAIALFLPLSMTHAAEAARKITHYGQYSYLVFTEGRNRVKGMWPVLESPLECRWGEGLS
jgi:hypothetical protein